MRYFVKLKFWLSQRASRPRNVGFLVLGALMVILLWRITSSGRSTELSWETEECTILDDEDCGAIPRVPEEDVLWCAEDGGQVISKASARQLGQPLERKVFLSVGIPTVQRTYKNVSESYLNETLNSLLTQLPPEEHQHVLFVILLADTDEGSRAKVRRSLEENFDWYIAQNMIHVISAPASFYPQLHGLPKTLHDGEERMYWRAKQTMDYVFLIHYCEGLAQYYMQLEDDVLIKPNYMQAIRELIDETVDLDWPYLQFTPWGFIGKVVRSENLTRLGRFLRMFYYEMPCDWLLYMTREFYNIRQEDTFFTSEELFTHIGHQSSSLGT